MIHHVFLRLLWTLLISQSISSRSSLPHNGQERAAHFIEFVRMMERVPARRTLEPHEAFALRRIKKYIMEFLPWRLDPERKERIDIRVYSLLALVTSLLECIVEHCTNETGKKLGAVILMKGNLHQALLDQSKDLFYARKRSWLDEEFPVGVYSFKEMWLA
ncbi:hypothetical protein D9613_001480 [Agrocybe pediades]|uniref:Uncharacterized protein n=1 Tax=Agrocybe pediades TaxID=84607 RepID=A0A8H4R8I0_9AGAR|nr:hypothetical protein D9613_001480 [Agrocybe pediades]